MLTEMESFMLTTVEAEIDTNGKVELLEAVTVTKRSRAIVTILDEPNGIHEKQGNGAALLRALRENPLPESSRRTAKEIDEWITELRNSWD